jgi:DNA end-binding protein Ku
MAGRAIWKGIIRFGDASVPVKLHTAIKEERIQFHLLHKRDHVRLRQQMVCAYENKPTPPEAQVKAVEVEEGKFIIVDPSELEQATPESSRIIEVHEFVDAEQIDPIFFDRAYYLEPDNFPKEYNALLGALKELEVDGVCTWAMRKRAYLGALQAKGKMLRLNTLRYADEVISVEALDMEQLREIPLSEKELKVGCDLINQLAAPFRPEKFQDEHQKKLQRLIEKKARGEKIVVPRRKHLKPTTSDKLLEALEASLKEVA